MPFGLSFGAKKQKTNQTSTLNKNESTNQAQSGTTASSGTTTSSSTGTTTGTTNSQQSTTQQSTTQQSGQQTGTTQQTTSSFSDPTLRAIETAVSDLFGKTGAPVNFSNFDRDSFIADTVGAASSDINAQLEAGVNQLITNTGGTASTNSMTALLSNRLRNDAAAEVAGVRANAVSQAEEILRQNALTNSQVAGQDQGFLTQLLAALKGGVTTTTGTESVASTQSQQSAQSGTATGSEQSAQQQSQQQTQTQQLIELMNQLLTGTTNTTGTETVKGTTKSMGGGFSLSL